MIESWKTWQRLLFATLLLASATLIYLATAKTAILLIDGEEMTVLTHARRVETALIDAGFVPQEGDRIYPPPSSALRDGERIEVISGQMVSVRRGSDVHQVRTTERTVPGILSALGILLMPGDRIWVDGIPLDAPEKVFAEVPDSITLQEATAIQLSVGGEQIQLYSSAPSLGEALDEAGIQLLEGDRLRPGPATPVEDVGRAVLRRAQPLTIEAEGEIVQTRVVADTVSEALRMAGVTLSGLDYTVPAPAENLPEDGRIRVIRVREEVLIEQVPVPFDTVYEAAPDLEIDQQTVLEPGSYGILATRVRVRSEDDQEVSRVIEGEWTAREPESRRIGYGTKIVIRTMSTPDGPIQYWRAVRMWATSYSPSRAGVPDDYPWFGITACGKKLKKGLVAIDNRYIPFHTMMYVPGYGMAEACDIGGGVIGRWIDLGYEDHNFKSWLQYVTVYFLTPVPPASSIAWIFP
jgi:uncharacterized protein YabE (DUF348 family)